MGIARGKLVEGRIRGFPKSGGLCTENPAGAEELVGACEIAGSGEIAGPMPIASVGVGI